MKIGIEGQRLYRRKKHGMDMVALELIKNLQKIDKNNEYVVFVKPDVDNQCIPLAPNFKIVELSGGPYPTWEQIALPKAAKKEGCDMLHCTGNTGPVWSKVPLITILHDIIYLEGVSLLKQGGSLYQRFGNIYRKWIVPPVVRKSRRVTTVSNFERDNIRNVLKLGDKLSTVYNGVSNHFKKIDDKEVLSKAKQKYNLPDNFLFFLGNTAPKKNTPNVLKAFALFNLESEEKYKLLMLDYEEAALQDVLKSIGFPEIRKDIHLTGYVPNKDMPAIINQCKAFLYPSLRESFGIPILEGMACGVPVITSNTSSMPEIAEDAAAIVDPYNPEEIKEGIKKVIQDVSYRNELIKKGLKRVKQFTWENMARDYLKLYEKVYNEIKS
jgi:glycosyltransferase involved in cell wall biosynthesis